MTNTCYVNNSKEFKLMLYKSFLKYNQYSFLSTFLNKKKYNLTTLLNRRECILTKRKRGNYRNFSLSRNQLRLFGNNGLLPGLKKSSW